MNTNFLSCLILLIPGTMGMYLYPEDLMGHGELPPPEEEIDIYEELDTLRTQLNEQERQRMSLETLVYDIADGLERHNDVIMKMADYLETVIDDENNSEEKEDYIPEKEGFHERESSQSDLTEIKKDSKEISESVSSEEAEETAEELRSWESHNSEQATEDLFRQNHQELEEAQESEEEAENHHSVEREDAEMPEEIEEEESSHESHSMMQDSGHEDSEESHMLEEHEEESESEERWRVREPGSEESKESHMLEEHEEERGQRNGVRGKMESEGTWE